MHISFSNTIHIMRLPGWLVSVLMSLFSYTFISSPISLLLYTCLFLKHHSHNAPYRKVRWLLQKNVPHRIEYGVATISWLLTIVGLFCKRALYTRLYSVQKTSNLKEPTNRSHPIVNQSLGYVSFSFCETTV